MIPAIAALALTAAVLIAIPGPSVIYLIGQSLAHGRRHALKGVIGNTIGTFTVGVIVAVGLGAALERVSTLSDILRGAGAAVLAFLGVIYLIQACRHRPSAPQKAQPRKTRIDNPLVLGIVIGATNPKALLIFATIVPAFLPRGAGPAALMALTAVPIAIGLAFDTLWVETAHRARAWLTRSPRGIHIIHGASGALMIAIAIVLGIEALPNG